MQKVAKYFAKAILSNFKRLAINEMKQPLAKSQYYTQKIELDQVFSIDTTYKAQVLKYSFPDVQKEFGGPKLLCEIWETIL